MMANSPGRVVRRGLVAIGVLLLVALAWLGLSGGVRQWPLSQGAGETAQTVAQLAYGLLSVLSILTTRWGRRWAPLVLAGWALSITIAAGLAPVVWGGSGWPSGLLAAAAALLIAVGIIGMLRSGGRSAIPALHIEASAVLSAPGPVVYGLIADYHHGHPSILPPEYFGGLVVEEGGRGAGSRIRFTMRALGGDKESRARVTEPEPGRVLVETVEGQGIVTTFTVDPLPDGKARVTIATEYPIAGIRGWIERLVVPTYLRKVYAAELRLLDQRAVVQHRARPA